MTTIIGKGVVPPAEVKNIIKDLFENEKIKYSDHLKLYTFAKVSLTTTQQNLLAAMYPTGYTAENFFILCQVDVIDSTGVVSSTTLKLVSFLEKIIRDGFIYGYYFEISDQSRFEPDYLETAHGPIEIASGASFAPLNYLEVYNDIRGNTVILGVDLDNSLASLQYSHENRYYAEDLLITGINEPTVPKIKLTGLSKSLKNQV